MTSRRSGSLQECLLLIEKKQMNKIYAWRYAMLEIDIPGFGLVRLEHLVTDFSGTLSVDGKLLPGVREQLNALAQQLTVHIITADTFGTVQQEVEGIPGELKMLVPADQDIQKEEFIKKLGVDHVVAIGNGNNDRRMLGAARLGIAVMEGEGAAAAAVMAAAIVVKNITDALGLLLNPTRCKATLRF
jgi:soluble P-type ATPase